MQTEDKTICFIGNTYTGKSSLIERYLHGIEQEDYFPTIEDVWTRKIERHNKLYNLRIVEVGGKDGEALKYDNLLEANVVVYVISVVDKESYNVARDELMEIVEFYNDNEIEQLPKIFIVGNKIDLVNERVVTNEDLLYLQLMNGLCSCTILETSLRDFKTIETLFMMFTVPNRLKTHLSKELIEIQRQNSYELMKQCEQQLEKMNFKIEVSDQTEKVQEMETNESNEKKENIEEVKEKDMKKEVDKETQKIPKQSSFRSLFHFKKFHF